MSLARFLVILVVGVLSVFYAEVLSGSSILWFLDPFGYIVLLPLYLFHLLLLFNFAVRFNRLSGRSLYLFGVIFGLYETWMTKVAWGGFVNGDSMFGVFLGFDVATFGLIVLFWHPFMSFIAPLVTLRVFMDYYDAESSLVAVGIEDFKVAGKWNWFFFYFFALFAAGSLSLNSGYNILVSLSGLLVSLLVVFLVVEAVTRIDRDALSFDSLILGKKGMILIGIYLGALYLLFFFGVRTEAIPGMLTIGLTILFYIFVALLIYLDKSGDGSDSSVNEETFSFRHLIRFYVIITTLTIILTFIGTVGFLVLVVLFLFAIVLGYLLFVKTIIKIFQMKS